jgi:hypothetical protein
MLFLVALLSGGRLDCTDDRILHLKQQSSAIVLAKVVEVGPSLNGWSGYFSFRQRVDYDITEVVAGKIEGHRIRVEHLVVAESFTADSPVARLSPKLFIKGNTLLLFLESDLGNHYQIYPESDPSGVRRFLDPDENCGAIPTQDNRFEHVKAVVLAPTSAKDNR